MKPLEGEELDRALDLFHDHRWVEQKPEISAVQLAELVPVLAPLYEQRPAKATKPKTTRKIAKPANPQPSPNSSRIPSSIRSAVVKRDGWSCQRCGRSIWGIRYGLQHRRPRGMGGSKLLHTMANLVVLCGWSIDPGTCTAWVEVEDRLGAAGAGWLVPNGVDPEEWPVLRFGRTWSQPGEAWVEAVPHPRQREMGAAA